jgi:hypothetical protein
MDRQDELLRLGEADRHIAVAERNITEQQCRLEKLRADGHDTKLAEQMLTDFQINLQTLNEHRDLIIKTIAQINQGLA